MAQRDLLCCDFPDGHVAIPLERVVGVVEGGPVTPLLYTAASFEGLVEAIGQVMPQVDWGRFSASTRPRRASWWWCPTWAGPWPSGCQRSVPWSRRMGMYWRPVPRNWEASNQKAPSCWPRPATVTNSLPISHVMPHDGRMISILSIDRLLPAQS